MYWLPAQHTVEVSWVPSWIQVLCSLKTADPVKSLTLSKAFPSIHQVMGELCVACVFSVEWFVVLTMADLFGGVIALYYWMGISLCILIGTHSCIACGLAELGSGVVCYILPALVNFEGVMLSPSLHIPRTKIKAFITPFLSLSCCPSILSLEGGRERGLSTLRDWQHFGGNRWQTIHFKVLL